MCCGVWHPWPSKTGAKGLSTESNDIQVISERETTRKDKIRHSGSILEIKGTEIKLKIVESLIRVWKRVGTEETNEIVMKMEITLKSVTWRGLL